MTDFAPLHTARDAAQKIRDAIAADEAALAEIQNEIALLQARITALASRQADKGLRAQLAAAEADVAAKEDALVEQINLELAAQILKRQASDPLLHHEWIAGHLLRLEASVRSGLDIPINQKFSMHPVLRQALALLPPRDDLNRAVFQLGHQMLETSWAARRRKIIAEAEASNLPLAAA